MPVDEGPLKDAKDILELKPTLTEDEQLVADKIRPQLRSIMRSEVRLELEADYIKKQAEFEKVLTESSQKAVKDAIEQWKLEQKPLDTKEIGQLLSQEYIEFTFTIRVRDIDGSVKDRTFVLVELPQEIEQKFLTTIRTRLVPTLKKLSSSEFKLDLGASAMEQLQSIVEAAPTVLDLLCEMVAVCLDPWGEAKPTIDEKWVKKHFSAHRILAVVMGQIECNRYRDFFLNGFRLSKTLK